MEAAIPSYLTLSTMINQTHRSMSILVDGKKAKDQFALEWASGDDLSHEGSIFLMNYQPSGREKMQKLDSQPFAKIRNFVWRNFLQN